MILDTSKSPFAKVYSINKTQIKWKDGFWLDRFNTNADVTIPHILSVFADKESYFHQVENFRIAAGLSSGEFRGTPYGDGDFYKLMEGMIYTYSIRSDEHINETLDEYIDLIGKAQQPDGYISTKQIIGSQKGVQRFGNIDDFEEYNFGHLFTAASVHYRVTGKDSFLNIACKCADFLGGCYRKILDAGVAQTAVCPSHYMGLFELYRVTGDKRYKIMGEQAIEIRNLVKNGTDDNQDRIPLKEHRKIVGHAVRSTYLYAGAADLYLETGDDEIPDVLDACWDNLMHQKIYITGGCGPLYTGTSPFGMLLDAQYIHQAFGYEYQLPNVTAYNETCGTLGHIFWAHRMFMREPKAMYLDTIERAYYNLILAAVSLDGGKYFYENMLRRTENLDYPVMWPVQRSDMFKCFCCPTNLSRSVPQAIDYTYKVDAASVYLGMYSSNVAHIVLANGADFTLEMTTHYPFDEKIMVAVTGLSTGQQFVLKVRVPGWVRSGSVRMGSAVLTFEHDIVAADADTFIDVPVQENTEVHITFDMPVVLMESHAKVEENTHQAAVMRGPLVYCVESHDVAGKMDDLMLLSDAEFTPEIMDVKGYAITALVGDAVLKNRSTTHDQNALYQPMTVTGLTKTRIRMVPYFAWDNRGFGEMKIWLPVHMNITI